MRLAFTGTREGMSLFQEKTFIRLIKQNKPITFLHGACVGSDELAVVSVYTYCKPDCTIEAYPGEFSNVTGRVDRKLTSDLALKLSDIIHPVATHFSRNRNLVEHCDLLIATPWQCKSQEPPDGQGGGTWYSIQYAMKKHVPVTIIWPDGETDVR